jgi:hypothetical protein
VFFRVSKHDLRRPRYRPWPAHQMLTHHRQVFPARQNVALLETSAFQVLLGVIKIAERGSRAGGHRTPKRTRGETVRAKKTEARLVLTAIEARGAFAI